ncbi:MAG: hypothetical protein ACLUD2_03165 [Clostridium sp.]
MSATAAFGEVKSRQQREEGLAYFCGYLTHYIGDSICILTCDGRIGYDAKAPNSHGPWPPRRPGE